MLILVTMNFFFVFVKKVLRSTCENLLISNVKLILIIPVSSFTKIKDLEYITYSQTNVNR